MIIRRDQIRAFEAYMKASFEDRMVAHIKSAYPDRYEEYTRGGDGDAGVRRVIQRAVDRAIALGARREGSIQQLLEIMVETSPDFESDPAMAWARQILEDQMLAGGTRILLAREKLSAHLARAERSEA